MLEAMRKHAKYFYVLFFIIILSFIFWGVAPPDRSMAVNVIEINGERVTVQEYWRAYENLERILKNIYGEQFDEEMKKRLEFREIILSNLIDDKVLFISAKELGIIVTDRELRGAIVNNPLFMSDGIFRKDIYFEILERNRLTPETFENMLRQQLTLLRMRGIITSVVDVNPLDLKDISEQDDRIKQLILSDKKEAAVRSYINSAKQGMKIRVNQELIS